MNLILTFNLNKKILLLYLVLSFFDFTSYGQISIPRISFNKTELPDTAIRLSTTDLHIEPALPDVKAIGRGMTTVSGWNGYLGMLNNPAFLSKENYAFELTDAQVTMPKTTIDAVSYLNSHSQDLEDGRFLRQLKDGVFDLRYYKDKERQEEALNSIYDASAFGNELLTNVIGTPENPIRHGFMAFPNFKFQYKNFGVSLYNVTEAAFLVTSGSFFNLIRNIHKMQDGELDEDLLIRLAGSLYGAYNTDDYVNSEMLPVVYSVAASNTALSVGYGKEVNNKLSIGANLHFYRRALSLGVIEAVDLKRMFDIAFEGFNNPVYEVNLTAGLNYKHSKNLSFGMVASNILPSKKIEAELAIDKFESKIDYAIHGESWMDSVSINLYSQKSEIVHPYSLTIPFILSAGTTWIPIKDLYVSAEWVDILANDNLRYNMYSERFRLGAEYMFLKRMLSLRVGMANLKPTIGGGVSIPVWNFNIDLDIAYAHTKLTNTAATYIQFKIKYRYNVED